MTALSLAGTYFTISVAGYVILSRSVKGNGIVKFFVSGILAGGGLVFYGILSREPAEWVSAVIFYAFLCELFIFFITFVGSSVSVSLLLMLRTRPLSESEINKLYADETMIDDRIRKLTETGFLRPEAKTRQLTGKGRVLLSGFRSLKRFFRHEGPERTLWIHHN